nr:hypothetical protein [Tanacetum cinerariifolium]
GSESRPHMLNKENYVPWSSRLICYAKSRPNGKLIHNSIINGPYVIRLIPKPGDTNREVPVNETFHVHIDDKLTEKELKLIEADDQAIQTILLGLPEDIYAAVNSCETAQEIWLRVQQMMKGSDIGIQEKKAKLFNEWERFTSNEGESIESYYHQFLELMNDLKRNKHFLEKIASNLKFLNNLQPEWSRHVTIVHQTKDLHTADYTQLYDFLKYNQKENVGNLYGYNAVQNVRNQVAQNPRVQNIGNQNGLIGVPGNANQNGNGNLVAARAEGNAAGHNGNLNGYNAVQNVKNQVAQNPRVQNIRNQNGLIGVPGNANQNGNGNLVAARAEGNAAAHNGNQIRCYNCNGVGHFARNCTVRPRRRDAAYLQTWLLIAQKEEAVIQLQDEEFDLMAAAADLDEIEEVNANCILMANLQQALTSGTQTDKALVYDSDGLAEVHDYENCNDNEIFNMFTQEEQYTDLPEPIPEPHQVPQNDNNVISEVTSVEHSGEIVEQHPVNFEETHALYASLYQNLAIEVEKVNTVNRKLKETNADLTTELARFKNQEKCFEIRIHNTKTRRPQPRSNTKNDRVPSVSKSSQSMNKGVEVEEHHRNLLLSKNSKHMLSAYNNFKLDSQNVYSKVVCAMFKKCLISVNYDECLLNYVYDKNSHGFIDADHPSHVYKLKKALYGLKQAPRAWRFHDDISVVQVYVDDIIFGSTNPRMESCDPVGTPMEIKDKLDLDQNRTSLDATKYLSMIGALMYLTSSTLNIVHATYLCARYQAKPTEKHLKEDVKTPSRVLPVELNS